MSISITDNSGAFLDAKDRAVAAALEAIGNQAVSHAKSNITAAGRVDSGNLRLSLTHTVRSGEECVHVGTDNEYAIYNEVGTGAFLEGGGGRKGGWFFGDDEGRWHFTLGMKPIHFLRNAVQNHTDEYKRVAEAYMRGG